MRSRTSYVCQSIDRSIVGFRAWSLWMDNGYSRLFLFLVICMGLSCPRLPSSAPGQTPGALGLSISINNDSGRHIINCIILVGRCTGRRHSCLGPGDSSIVPLMEAMLQRQSGACRRLVPRRARKRRVLQLGVVHQAGSVTLNQISRGWRLIFLRRAADSACTQPPPSPNKLLKSASIDAVAASQPSRRFAFCAAVEEVFGLSSRFIVSLRCGVPPAGRREGGIGRVLDLTHGCVHVKTWVGWGCFLVRGE